MKLKALLVLALLASSTAEASYVRIWRGHQKADLADDAFLRVLNHALLPATGELAHGPAKLESYLPVVLPKDLAAGSLPEEVAMLAYESEDAYRAYRATAEGQHYGNMHWDLFDKATSASLVPTPYTSALTIESAYEVVPGAPDTFRVVLREPTQSDQDFLAFTKSHIESTLKSAPTAYYVLVAQNYVLEYLKGARSERSAFSTQLPIATSLTHAQGIRYNLKDRAHPDTRTVWQRHIAAWNARDLDAITADYTADAVVIRNDEIFRGPAQIRLLFADLFAIFDKVEKHTIDRVIQEGDTVFLNWAADGNRGTDTFVIAGDRITVQTIFSPAAPSSTQP